MKALVTILAIGVVVGGVVVAVEVKGRSESKIEYTAAPDTKHDRKDLRALVARYYDGLRAGKYADVAMLYTPEAAEAVGGRVELARALKGATDLLGVPAKVELHGIRIEGEGSARHARAEVVIPDADASGQYVLKDGTGKVLGKWAKTLHFEHHEGRWMMSDISDNEADIDMKAVHNLLERLESNRAE